MCQVNKAGGIFRKLVSLRAGAQRGMCVREVVLKQGFKGLGENKYVAQHFKIGLPKLLNISKRNFIL